MPKAWTQDWPRREQAAVPQDVEFATKPELAIRMLTRALDAGVPASWVTGDEVHGQHRGLRAFLQTRGMSYVLCVASNQWVWTDNQPGSAGAGGLAGRTQLQVKTLAATVPPQAFKKLSAGKGAKGPRIYSWARTPVLLPGKPGEQSKAGWLLIRRSLTDPTDCAYYLCSAPTPTTLATLVTVAGTRWAIEETFQTAKTEVGLDHDQVRRYDRWYRQMTLAMFAHAFSTVTRATSAGKGGIRPRPGPHRAHRPRGPPTPEQADLEPSRHAHRSPQLVAVATPPPSPRPPIPLRRPRRLPINAAEVPGRRRRAMKGSPRHLDPSMAGGGVDAGRRRFADRLGCPRGSASRNLGHT